MRALSVPVAAGRRGPRPWLNDALRAHGAQLLRRRPLRVELEARLARARRSSGRCRSTAPRRSPPSCSRMRSSVRPARRVRASRPAARRRCASCSRGRWPACRACARPRFRPASSAPSTLTSNQLSMRARDELVATRCRSARPGTKPTSAKIAASLTSRRLPNLPRRSREARRTNTQHDHQQQQRRRPPCSARTGGRSCARRARGCWWPA